MVEVEGRAKYFPAKPSMPRVHTHPSGDVALTLPCPESPLADVIAHDCKHRSQNCSTLVQIVWRANFSMRLQRVVSLLSARLPGPTRQAHGAFEPQMSTRTVSLGC